MTEAEVRMQTLPQSLAQRQMASPVETSRKGEIRGMTLTVPLLSGRDSYLVVRVPEQSVKDLAAYVLTLPEKDRSEYVRQWVLNNQQAVLEQYVRNGRQEKRFNYDVMPVKSSAGLLPRKNIPTPKPVSPAPAYQPPAAKPATYNPPDVTVAPLAPVEERTISIRERPKRPEGIKSGAGTETKPYLIEVLGGEGNKFEYKVPVRVRLTSGEAYEATFLFTFHESDIGSKQNVDSASTQLKYNISKMLDYVSRDKNLPFESTALKDTLNQVEARFRKMAREQSSR